MPHATSASSPAVVPIPGARVQAPERPAPAIAPSWLDRSLFSFTPRWFELPAGQGRLHFIDEGAGAGDPIVFVHGTPTWSFDFRHLIAALSAQHRCIAVDHLGFGLSDRPT